MFADYAVGYTSRLLPHIAAVANISTENSNEFEMLLLYVFKAKLDPVRRGATAPYQGSHSTVPVCNEKSEVSEPSGSVISTTANPA